MPGGGKGGKGKGGGEIKITGDESKPVSFDMAGGLTMVSETGGTGTPVELRTEMGGTGTPLATRTEMGGTGTPLATALTVSVPDVIRTDTHSRSEMAVTEPIQTSSDMRLDVKPMVVDLCLTAGIGKIPRLCITRPYDHHVSLRVLGTEVFGMDLSGQRRAVIDDLPPRPAVVWGAVSPGQGGPPRPAPRVEWLPGEPGDEAPHRPGGAPPPASRRPSPGGLHIRLGD